MLSTNGDLWWAGGDLTRLASLEKAKGRRISNLPMRHFKRIRGGPPQQIK
jgi:hypothetical protein